VPYTTLCDRINGRPGRREGHQAQQLLSDAEETTLCDWIEYYALVAKPLDIQGILNLAAEISGKQPGKNWIDRFKTRHPKLCYSKPGGLDPKRAQNFNPTNAAAAESSIPVHSAEPSEPPVSVPDDSNSTSSRPFTRSQNASSSAVSISIALDPTRAPMPTSHEEKDTEIARLRIAYAFMSKALAQKDQELLRSQAMVAASNAHCTIIKRAESSAREELQNRKNKTRRTVKTSARYVAHDTMKELHASQTQERLRREKETAEKEARKVKEGIARDARIQEEIKTRIFSGAWPLYLHSFT